MTVRWLASLIAAVCLVAAGQVRPEDAPASWRESLQLLSATSAGPACITLRPYRPRPTVRPWPYEAPRAPVLTLPLRCGMGLAPQPTAEIAWPAPPVPLSRGPPRA